MVTLASLDFLKTIELCKRFGGLEAVKNVNLEVGSGELRALIGPNGAGKTTLVSMISGRTKPTSGSIVFMGKDITKTPAHKRAKMGIVYTFQLINIYRTLSVYENLRLAVQRNFLKNLSSFITVDEDEIDNQVENLLERIGLEDYRDKQASLLPYGYQRLLDIGLSLALDPQLLILDEPMQGLTIAEIEGVKNIIRDIHKEKRTILLIEHNIQVVMELAEKITVMDKGVIIAEGKPEEIEEDTQVRRVYLGNDVGS